MESLQCIALKKVQYSDLVKSGNAFELKHIIEQKRILCVVIIQRAWRRFVERFYIKGEAGSSLNYIKNNPKARSLVIKSIFLYKPFYNICCLPRCLVYLEVEGEFVCRNLDINCPNLKHLSMSSCFMEGYLPSTLVSFSAICVYSYTKNFMRNCHRIKNITVNCSGNLMDKAWDIHSVLYSLRNINTYIDTLSTSIFSEYLYKLTRKYNIITKVFFFTPLYFPYFS